MNNDKIELTRDVEATLIPQGTKMNLNKGDSVVITHRLGGNFTIMTENGMFRIDGKNADAGKVLLLLASARPCSCVPVAGLGSLCLEVS